MKRFRMLAMAGAVTIGGALASPLAAQSRQPDQVPDGYKPPAGMCRIWVDGVPANRQPAPTDCATAVKNRPANGRVIFGERTQGSSSEPFLRSFGGKEKARDRDKERERPREAERERPRQAEREKPKNRERGLELPRRRP